MIDDGAFALLRRDVIEAGLCTACGTCIAVCDPCALHFREDAPEPATCQSGGKRIYTECGRCLELCPARHVPMDEHVAAHAGTGAVRPPSLGTYIAIVAARAADEEIRGRGASGGVGVALQQFLVSTGRVAAALTTTFDPDHPWQARPVRAFKREDLLRGAQSKYQPSPVCSLLRDDDSAPSPVVMAGLPCHLHGLRTLQQSRASVAASSVRLAIGLFCGGMWSLAGTRALLTEALHVPLEQEGSKPPQHPVRPRARRAHPGLPSPRTRAQALAPLIRRRCISSNRSPVRSDWSTGMGGKGILQLRPTDKGAKCHDARAKS